MFPEVSSIPPESTPVLETYWRRRGPPAIFHAFANNVRGKVHQEVRKLSWVKRWLGRKLKANDPLRYGTWEGAELHQNRAIERDPTIVLFYLDLGETYERRGKVIEAIRVVEGGLRLPERYPMDQVFKERMSALLVDLRSR